MPETLLDIDSTVLAFKGLNWQVKREATYEWAVTSPEGDPVGVLHCVTAAGSENNPVFNLTLPGITETTLTEGTDWLGIIEYSINEYLDKQGPRARE